MAAGKLNRVKEVIDNQNGLPPSVVIGVGANGLSIIRSLGRKGISVINLTSNSSDYSIKSKYSLKVYFKNLRGDELINRLLDLSKSIGEKAVLFCTSDLDVVTVSRHREKLQQCYHLILPPQDVVETLMSKRLFYEFAVKNDFKVPQTYFTNTKGEVEEVSKIISYPCVIKPEYHDEYWDSNMLSVYGIKVLYAESKDSFERYFKQYSIANRPLVIQEWIDGGDSDVVFCLTYIDICRRPVAVFTGRKIRQYPPLTGSTSLAESVFDPDVADKSLELLMAAGCLGICSVEFKRSAKNKELYITEPTVGRVDTQEGISISAGMDIPYMCYLDAIGYPPGHVPSFKEGVKWINESFDLFSLIEYMSNGSIDLKEVVSTYRGTRSYCLWSVDDPKPFLAFVSDMFKRGFRKFLRRL